jgi:hypothetical protein
MAGFLGRVGKMMPSAQGVADTFLAGAGGGAAGAGVAGMTGNDDMMVPGMMAGAGAGVGARGLLMQIAKMLKAQNPMMPDEQVMQTAMKIVQRQSDGGGPPGGGMMPPMGGGGPPPGPPGGPQMGMGGPPPGGMPPMGGGGGPPPGMGGGMPPPGMGGGPPPGGPPMGMPPMGRPPMGGGELSGPPPSSSPYGERPQTPMGGMANGQAARNQLMALLRERRMATDPEDIALLDKEIAALREMGGMG